MGTTSPLNRLKVLITLRHARGRVDKPSDSGHKQVALCAPFGLRPSAPVLSPLLTASALLFYHSSFPFSSGRTRVKARMPTSIMESSGSKVVQF